MEDILRQRLRQHPTPLDTDALWDKVEPRLPQKRNAFLFLWKWAAASLVLLGGLYLFLFQPPVEQLQVDAPPLHVVQNVAPPTSPAPASAPLKKATELQSAPARSTPPAAPKAGFKKPFLKATIPAAPAIELPVIADSPVEGTTSASVSRQTPTAAPFLSVPQGYAEITQQYQRTAFNLPEEVRSLAKADLMAVREAQTDLTKATEEKPKSIRKKQAAYWTLEPGIALSLTGRSISPTEGNPGGSQAEVNNQYEQALEAITFQGLAGYHHSTGLSLRTGLAFTRINSKVESVFTTTGTEPVETIIAIIESPNGSRSEQTGIVQVENETVTTEKYYNSITSMDIPLLIGYRFGGTKWGFTVEAGPTFNLSSGGTANLYDGAGNYRTVGSEHFRSKREGQGFMANFGGAYNLSKKTMLTANLRLQGFGNGGFEEPSVGYATRYTLIGVQLGYRVRF